MAQPPHGPGDRQNLVEFIAAGEPGGVPFHMLRAAAVDDAPFPPRVIDEQVFHHAAHQAEVVVAVGDAAILRTGQRNPGLVYQHRGAERMGVLFAAQVVARLCAQGGVERFKGSFGRLRVRGGRTACFVFSLCR